MPGYPGYYQNAFGANYLPQNNYGAPFMQPGYQNYQQGYPNGYSQQMQTQQNSIQQMQTPQTPPQVQNPTAPAQGFYGKIITKPEDFAPNDVMMDGSKGYFPMSDGSRIYVKYWKPDGTIGTDCYIPENAVTQEKPDPFAETLRSIEDRLSKIETALTE